MEYLYSVWKICFQFTVNLTDDTNEMECFGNEQINAKTICRL